MAKVMKSTDSSSLAEVVDRILDKGIVIDAWAKVSLVGIELYGQRSLPQIHARVTRTSASVGSTILASGTVSTRTSCTPYITVARI